MASWMVHLRIADELLNRIDDLDETTFVLGNIAPDSGVPNEDWSVFTPPTNVTHFKTKPEERTFIDIDKFITEYFSSEAINGYTQKEYSFFLGYYRSDDHGDLYRDYKYLSKERYDSFVDEAVDKIKTII